MTNLERTRINKTQEILKSLGTDLNRADSSNFPNFLARILNEKYYGDSELRKILKMNYVRIDTKLIFIAARKKDYYT